MRSEAVSATHRSWWLRFLSAPGLCPLLRLPAAPARLCSLQLGLWNSSRVYFLAEDTPVYTTATPLLHYPVIFLHGASPTLRIRIRVGFCGMSLPGF